MKLIIFICLAASSECFPEIYETEGLTAEAVNATEYEVGVEIRDEHGELVSQSDIFINENFQVEKPVNRSVCLIKELDFGRSGHITAMVYAVDGSRFTILGISFTVARAIGSAIVRGGVDVTYPPSFGPEAACTDTDTDSIDCTLSGLISRLIVYLHSIVWINMSFVLFLIVYMGHT
ncbi:hypothetical protein MAR_037863 [Mya arenaria]|uniref:Uncharacterized protein n=1 Tax=Mya arenaria TaxID=6604 RepID=A0ABY7FSD4_MYAAR|nr:hypothetical protein MAR_037863 [Mya arenaria]